MVIIAQVTFPREFLIQTVEILMELEPLPETIEMSGPFYRTGGDEKIHAIAYYNTDDFKGPNDPMEIIKERYLRFGNVPNFVFEVHYWRTMDESLSTWIR